MGVAEIIPGVSGGTLAFITGIYNELINSIRSINFESISFLIKLKLRKFWKHVNGNFLLTLVLGMITSIVLFSRIISFLLTNYNFHIWGFFFGLIISSAILISRNINDLSLKNYVFLIFGLFVSGSISLLSPSSSPNSSFFIFLSGAIAISAMILPGISGSFILVFLSKYEFILNSLNNFDMNVLSVFIMGCIFGLLTFSRLLSYLFNRFNDVVISVLVGFLLGSLFKIWPFIEVVEYTSTNEPLYTRPIFPSADLSTEILFFTIFSIFGFLIMWILEKKIIGISKSN